MTLNTIQKDRYISVRFKKKEVGRIFSQGDAFKYAPRGWSVRDAHFLYESVQDILDELQGPSLINWKV